jgi:hypothetical protein
MYGFGLHLPYFAILPTKPRPSRVERRVLQLMRQIEPCRQSSASLWCPSGAHYCQATLVSCISFKVIGFADQF